MVSLGYMVHLGEIELQEIVNGLINTQMYNSLGISITLISITVGLGFTLSPAPFHQWTPDVHEGVWFIRQIPTSISISEKEVMNPLFNSYSPTPVVTFLSVILKVAASASAARILDIPFYFSSNEWHLLLEILVILSMIFGNLLAITQTSMKRMLAYSSIGQIGYVIIGIIVGNSNDNLYAVLYLHESRNFFLRCIIWSTPMSLIPRRPSSTSKFLRKTLPILVLMASRPIFLRFSRLLMSILSIYYYLKIIKLLMTGRNQEITPYVRNYRRRSNNSIELSMTVCVIASTIPGILMNPILAIAQDTLF
ncbi:unnamed protein product [Triticum turgidum subsp. durum]|uniref:NADH:quinone oxidoreductase/Mrp antiporter transmembrane domain-containing protein n=3 Tax=Triticum TaxID=4564 RepID=A0A9R1BAG7_TRITD|nr:unnamed protein product [Triticum turgidum subsp. durum]